MIPLWLRVVVWPVGFSAAMYLVPFVWFMFQSRQADGTDGAYTVAQVLSFLSVFMLIINMALSAVVQTTSRFRRLVAFEMIGLILFYMIIFFF